MYTRNMNLLQYAKLVMFLLLVILLGMLRVQAQRNGNSVLIMPAIPSVGNAQAVLLDLNTLEESLIPIDYREPVSAVFSPTADYVGVTWSDTGGNLDIYLLTIPNGIILETGEAHIQSGFYYYGISWISSTQFSYIVYDLQSQVSQFCSASVEAPDVGYCVSNVMRGYVGQLYDVDSERFLFNLVNRDLLNVAVPVVEPRIYLAQRVGDGGMEIVADFPGESPALTANRQQVAYCVANEAGFRDIYVSAIDGSDAQNITRTPDIDECAPHWSFDAVYLSFEARPTVENTFNQQQKICMWSLTTDVNCISDLIGDADWYFHNAVWSTHDYQLILRGRNLQDRTYHNYLVDLTLNVYQPLMVLEDAFPVVFDWMPVEVSEP